jgi:3-oxoacyl-[acyl-carrier protein] reductase
MIFQRLKCEKKLKKQRRFIMDLMIKGKVAVVAAASKGLGRAVAEALAEEGVNLAICSRDKDRITETADYLQAVYDVEVLPVICDVTDSSQIIRFKEKVIDRFKTCHILFTNAGGPPPGSLENFTGEDFKKAIDLNLMSAINLFYAFLPYMKSQKWGRVIASTSTNVRQLLLGYPLSNVSRIAVSAFIKSAAMEFAHLNITANVLVPGLFLTDLVKESLQNRAKREGIQYSDIIEKTKNTIPTRTIGNPKDFGAFAAFLASENASYITGETFLIDGGEYAGLM